MTKLFRLDGFNLLCFDYTVKWKCDETVGEASPLESRCRVWRFRGRRDL